jgi:hypothetical protein
VAFLGVASVKLTDANVVRTGPNLWDIRPSLSPWCALAIYPNTLIYQEERGRNDYQKVSCGVMRGRRVRLTTSQPYVSWLSRKSLSTSHKPTDLNGLLRDSFTSSYIVLYLVKFWLYTADCCTFYKLWFRGMLNHYQHCIDCSKL